MNRQGLQNVQKYSCQFEVIEDSAAYLVLMSSVTGKRQKNWLQVLLNYEGVGELKVPGSFITAVPDITKFTVNQVVEILDISRSTYYRVKDELRLDPETADKIASLLKLFYYGLEAFEGNKQEVLVVTY